MGFMDKVKEGAALQQHQRQERDAALSARCPDPGTHYVTEVNRGSVRMQTWQSDLTKRYRQGYRLAHVFEQDGNTVQVFEHWHE